MHASANNTSADYPSSDSPHLATDRPEAPSLVETVRRKAKELGFCKVGILSGQQLREQNFFKIEGERLRSWLNQNYQAEMQWMATHLEKRLDPLSLMEDTRSIVCVAMNYYTPDEYASPHPAEPENALPPLKIAKYARGTDYHYVVKDRLKELLTWLQTIDPSIKGRALTDSAPILEKPLAQAAGLGWIGKNGNLLTPDRGSFLFLGELLLNVDLEAFSVSCGVSPNAEAPPSIRPLQPSAILREEESVTSMPGCGSCTRCIDACPTGAILHDDQHYGVVDANRCISYWTIEYKGPSFPKVISQNLSGWIFGCDICQDVCPWNIKFSSPTAEPEFQPRPWNRQPKASEILNLTPEDFRERYRKSPIKRTKLEGFQRNVQEALQQDTLKSSLQK